MVKVLVFGITDIPGGVESVIMNYYTNIDKSKVQFDFLCNTEKVAYEEEIKNLGGKIYRITARSKNIKEYKRDLKIFFEEHAKEYTTIWVNLCSLANIDYLKYAKKYGIKNRIIHSHNSQNMDSYIRGMLHKLNKIVLGNYATDFWSCSNEASEWFFTKKMIKSSKFLKINNAIDVKKFLYNKIIREKYRKDMGIEEKIVIGHVGRFHFQKNHTFLIKVFSEICKLEENAKLILIGIGPDEEKIKKMVREEKLEEKVLFLETRNDVNNLMQAMDVFVFPSFFEGLPVTLVEAQAASLPLIISETITKEIIINKELISFLNIEDAEEWANEILKKVKNNKRTDTTKFIKESGYDILEEAKKLENIFIKNDKI